MQQCFFIVGTAILISCSNEKKDDIKRKEIENITDESTLGKSDDVSMIDEFFSNPVIGMKGLGKDISLSQAEEAFGKPIRKEIEKISTSNTKDELSKVVYYYLGFSIIWATKSNDESEICISRVFTDNSLEMSEQIKIGESADKIEKLFGNAIKMDKDQIVYEINSENGLVVFKMKNEKVEQIELHRNIE